MSDERRSRLDDDAIEPQLERAVRKLRQTEPVPPAWRAALLAAVATPAAPRGRSRPWGRSPLWWVPLGAAAALLVAAGFARFGTRRADSRVRFSVSAPAAKAVSLVGDFDGWNPAALPMRRDVDEGRWFVDVHLPPGRHVFAFSVDGGLRADPTAPRAVEDDFGVPSSVIVVPSRGGD